MNASREMLRSEPALVPATQSPEQLELSIRRWLQNYLSEVLGLDCTDLDDSSPFERYGLDSSAAVALADDLGQWLGIEIDPSLTYDHPCVADLARALSATHGRTAAQPHEVPAVRAAP